MFRSSRPVLSRWRIVLTGSVLLALTYFCICLGLYLGQRRLIFRPAATHAQQPSDWQLAYQTVWIPVGQDRLPRALTRGTYPLPDEPAQVV